MRKILSFLFVSCTTVLFAQPSFEWAIGQGGIDSDIAEDIVADASGNTYLTGVYRSTVDFDPGVGTTSLTSNGSTDIFIEKLDNNGNLVWVKSIGGTSGDQASSIAIDSNGDILVTGFFRGTVDLDPGAGTTNFTATNGDYDTFIIKLDANGDLIWVKVLDADIQHCFADNIAVDGNDNVVVLGRWFGTADFDPGVGTTNLSATGNGWNVYVLKLNTSGDFIWVKQVSGSTDTYVQGLVLDQQNDVLISGYFYETVDLDPGAGTDSHTAAPFQEDMFLLKLDQIGDYVWAHSFAATTAATEIAHEIVVDNNNDYYFAGSFGGTVDFDPGTGTTNLSSAGGDNGFILKLDQAGVFQAVYQLESSSSCEIFGLTLDSNQDIICGGVFTGTTDFDPGTGNFDLTSAGLRDIFYTKINQSGGFEWALSIGDAQQDYFRAIDADNNGSIYTTGYFQLTLDVDPGAGTVNLTSNGANDYYVQELNECIPTAPLADQASLSDLTSECLVSAPTSPTGTNCSGTYTGTPDVTFPITTQGTTTITWTYDDGNGNTSTQTQEVIIDDVTAPVADVASLSDVTAECEVTSLTAPTATDNCVGTITGTHNATLPITSTTTITWTYDDGNGNTSTQTQEVIIDDVTAPVADNASLTTLTDECEVTSLTAPTATDNCAGIITGTHNASLPITTQGTTTITWTYDDGNGNTSTQTQDIVISDATVPAADAANLADINSECEVTPTAPTATDNCTGAVTGAPDVSFPITASGTTTVTWTYDDGNGNTSTQTQDVIITPIDNSVSIVNDITLSADAAGYTYQWVDCEDNNTPIAGETNQTFEATANGSYAVIIDNGNCSVTSVCNDITTVGLDQNQIETISVFPNPTSGSLTIRSSGVFDKIEIMNTLGQVVSNIELNQLNEYQIQLPDSKGVYMVKVSDQAYYKIVRVIKK